ncbi:aromatic ring-hydroxylating oxygenase subunit alpha [Amorphus orientalis]|uniref:Rieske 2Fe-2S family protein n=1 Tax=Amorphus orientalis TaxID=649198 RepID=A0AAE3VLZ3_9HYPH|nr:aromatic ring-hydroxylating dioxygenase subunit alpha [Amorphus orientalis]MDQ0314388.1 Rieske 2Fe-2S family protein [Amorphus orientalis]
MDVQDEMRQRLAARQQGFTLEQPFYTDPAYFDVDMKMVWYREWLFAGHDCEVPRPGAFFTLQVGDYPVIVVRDREGQIRAFHNSCRHRGSRVCSAARGTSARLVCPYHQWTYDLDGSLVFARQMGPDFDASAYGLKSVACESVGGYVFISLADTPADFGPTRDMIEPYLAPHNLADTKVAHETTIIEKGNWKLVWENNRECYHCAGNHPELCKTYPEAPGVTGVSGGADDPEIAAHWAHCEALGLPSAFRMADDGHSRITRMPLLRDAVSYTMSGRPAVSKPLTDAIAADHIGAMLLFHYPTNWNHILGDHAITFRVLPIGPQETAVTTKWLVNREAVEGVDYDLDELIHVWTETNDQDRQIVEENAFGIRSPAYEPGPYSSDHEGGVDQFVDWYCRIMALRLTEEDSPTLRVA